VLATGSRRGLEAIARGEAMLAGVHLLDPGTGAYNIPHVKALVPQGDIVVIHWARRVQGLLVAAGNPLNITGLPDVAERGLRLARRGDGAGSQLLLEVLLDRAGLSMDAIRIAAQAAETERDLASLIAMDEADCALGVAAAAGGLGFLPLWPAESFDLVLRRRDYFEPAVQNLLAFARNEAFARRAAHLGGYDLGDLGLVRFNA